MHQSSSKNTGKDRTTSSSQLAYEDLAYEDQLNHPTTSTVQTRSQEGQPRSVGTGGTKQVPEQDIQGPENWTQP